MSASGPRKKQCRERAVTTSTLSMLTGAGGALGKRQSPVRMGTAPSHSEDVGKRLRLPSWHM